MNLRIIIILLVIQASSFETFAQTKRDLSNSYKIEWAEEELEDIDEPGMANEYNVLQLIKEDEDGYLFFGRDVRFKFMKKKEKSRFIRFDKRMRNPSIMEIKGLEHLTQKDRKREPRFGVCNKAKDQFLLLSPKYEKKKGFQLTLDVIDLQKMEVTNTNQLVVIKSKGLQQFDLSCKLSEDGKELHVYWLAPLSKKGMVYLFVKSYSTSDYSLLNEHKVPLQKASTYTQINIGSVVEYGNNSLAIATDFEILKKDRDNYYEHKEGSSFGTQKRAFQIQVFEGSQHRTIPVEIEGKPIADASVEALDGDLYIYGTLMPFEELVNYKMSERYFFLAKGDSALEFIYQPKSPEYASGLKDEIDNDEGRLGLIESCFLKKDDKGNYYIVGRRHYEFTSTMRDSENRIYHVTNKMAGSIDIVKVDQNGQFQTKTELAAYSYSGTNFTTNYNDLVSNMFYPIMSSDGKNWKVLYVDKATRADNLYKNKISKPKRGIFIAEFEVGNSEQEVEKHLISFKESKSKGFDLNVDSFYPIRNGKGFVIIQKDYSAILKY